MNNIEKVLKYMLLGATLHDINGNMLYMNPTLLDLLKITDISDYINKPINDGVFGSFIKDTSDITYINDNVSILDDEIIKFDLNNDTLWIKMNSIVIKNGTEYIIVTYENISDTFNYSHLYKEIFNNIKSGIIILKPYKDDFIIKDINPYVYEIDPMLVKNKIIGEKLSTMRLPLINGKQMIEHVRMVFNSTVSINLENIYYKCDYDDYTSEHWRNIYIHSIKTGEIIIIYDDISDNVKYKMKLEESDRHKSKFISNMSHEIRNPVNTIAGFSDLLYDLNENENEKRVEYVNIIKNSSEVLNNLVDDILDMSKIEAGKLSIDKSPFDVNKIINQLYVSYKNKTNNKVRMIKKMDVNSLFIYNDDIRLRQVLSNLISNSIKFTKKGYIEFGYDIKDNDVVIYVKDTGVGIKETDKSKIFKRFQRLKEKITDGHGLGLSISHELSALMGGELYFESTYNEGSSFFLKLPIGLTKTNKLGSRTTKIPQIDLKDKTILLVEDVEFNQKLILSYLEPTNVNMIVAVDGNDALIKYNENRNIIDLILMDIQIPEMNGKDVTETIRTIDKKTPIIAQTAYVMVNEIEEVLNYGFNDLINKPIKKEKLIEIIIKYINIKKESN